jgi:hypothetical protein
MLAAINEGQDYVSLVVFACVLPIYCHSWWRGKILLTKKQTNKNPPLPKKDDHTGFFLFSELWCC